MSGVPELKQKKVARDQKIAAEAKVAAGKAAAAAKAHEETIFAKAQAYEQEYQQVYLLFYHQVAAALTLSLFSSPKQPLITEGPPRPTTRFLFLVKKSLCSSSASVVSSEFRQR